MPSEAPEILMQDALEAALGQIAVEPTIPWVMTTPPELQVGIPGDPVPAPDVSKIYVQHVNSNVGSDNVGTCQHRLDATFHIWCVCSHPANAPSRMLQLKTDVVRALLAAEPAFYEQFPYGIEIGPFSFSSDEMYIRAGCAAGVQEVRISTLLTHDEEDMTEAQVLALIHQEMMRHGVHRHFDNFFDILPQGAAAQPGRRTAGFSQQRYGYLRGISLPIAANSCFELVESPYVTASQYELFDQEWIISCVINRGNEIAPPQGNCFTGIELGTYGPSTSPANWNTVTVLGTGAVAQMRFNHTLERFELSLYGDNGEVPVIYPFPVNPQFTPDNFQKEFKLHILPRRMTGLLATTFRCYLNGELMLTVAGGDSTADMMHESSVKGGVGYFVCNGSGGDQTLSETGFYDMRIYQPDYYDQPDPPNPLP